ncbi:insulin-like growth factor-binding protein-related protein 1 isoform X2 [Eriocheir sinensis]|uniref:insulin-like growth factor-binding protein-related protein 1 isoform X2 n=1 Tax=Eriocheir sinensis TaxID=95602 RepID=UPI0021C5E69B|nr:insulin-like growth factor-binding protein-related protein 1 isoform X2 [Eriocheir sinensis]
MAGSKEWWVIPLTLFLTLSLSHAQDAPEPCGECDSTCPDVTTCKYGVVKDVCGCCEVCARGLGQRCDEPYNVHENAHDLAPHKPVYGSCGEYLVCVPRTDLQDSSEHTCQCSEDGQVCGSDGQTYTSLCHLLARTYELTDLHVAVRGPCMEAPTIRSTPEDTSRPLGSILVLDCEAKGFPVPTITWVLNKPDGSSLELPGDDSSFAVQVRGGPESNMVTGWVQIMRITKDTLGIYTCLAKNSEGEARASATVTELKPERKQYPKKA